MTRRVSRENTKGQVAKVKIRKRSHSQTITRFPIVGIGASAGGLEALSQLLAHLPIDTGMAFVLVQHLDPKHGSLSADIFSRVTRMKVTEVKEGVRVQPNCVYLLPPNFSMGILNGALKLLPRTETRGLHLVIDFFLQSLAEDLKNLAVGVILSGTGSDGTQGLLAIKAEGGITFAQAPESAKFDSMPQNAIASGAVDLILGPKQIAEELTRIAHHPYVVPEASEASEENLPLSPHDSLSHIFLLLRNLCHVDFTLYKANTIRRRIERRMVLNKSKDMKAYAKLLSSKPDEVRALYADLLINVTSFFRDPKAYKSLTTDVFPKLMKGRSAGVPIRVWSPGCATGEEVYSLAISFLEFLGEKASEIPIQIFGTDISEQAIQKARLGEYPETISREVSRERLNRFFIKMDGGGYKIAKSIRDICLFSRHDVTADPPFARMDLISCRNLLIYFTAALQKHVIPIFHYALNPKGFLWLGRSETIGGFSDLLSLDNKTHKIFSRKHAPITLSMNFPSSTYVPGQQGIIRKHIPFPNAAVDAQKMTDRAIQEQYPGVLINEEMEILQFRGHTGPFIDPAPGLPSHNLLKMANPEILSDLRVAIQAAKKHKVTVKKVGLSLREGRNLRTISLKVIPIKPAPPVNEYYYLIHFEIETDRATPKLLGAESGKAKSSPTKARDTHLIELQQQLISNQEYQQSLVEEYEAAQENLTAANEELQSSNEELQSTNEELETAKEELQSGNEELTTVNDELQARNLEQIQTNNDLINLLGSAQIPIVMLGHDRRIRRFTPLAGKALNLIQTDVGRPLSDLRLNFTAPGIVLNLEQMVSEVIETMEPQEIEVQDYRERWFRLQVRPYKTLDGKIDGAVLALVDIDFLKQSLKEVKAAKTEAEKANRAKDLFLATLSHELRTPLTAILSWAQMLQTGKLDAEKILRAGRMIEDCGKTQASLINDLLDVSRIIMGKLSLEMKEVNPEEIIVKAIDSVRPTADKNSIRIETAFDPRAGTVMADPLRLQQVFLNLLTNAIKFSSPNSIVFVKLEKSNGPAGEIAKVLIAVSDSGKGISSEFIPHIFDSFSQEDNSSVRVHGGLGLGLAIVRSLVELQGGSITAESPGENQGATFTVILPKKSGHKSSETKKNEEDAKTHQTELGHVRLVGLRLLVVEDEASTREAFTEMLQSYGAEVKTASSAREALKAFEQYNPDVLVSDIAMPNEDGYSLIRKIRALGPKRGGNTPSIAVTALAGEEDIQRALSSGFQSHVAKPVDFVKLANVIATLARNKSKKK